MENKRKEKKKILKGKYTPLLFATFLMTLGVYFSFPERGFLATLPVMLLFSFFASSLFPKIWFSLLAGGGIALFYGVMAYLDGPVFFFAVSTVLSLCGFSLARCIFSLKKGKKGLKIALIALSLAVGILLPMFYLGTPVAFWQQKEKVENYLATTYPDQTFSRITMYFDRKEDGYQVRVAYPNGENTLTSNLFFNQKVEDGFFDDYSAYLLTRRKADLIEAFYSADLSVITEEGQVLLTQLFPIPGSYGVLDERLLPQMTFSVTFREEMPDRKDFAAACSTALTALQERGIVFDEITFFALDGGRVALRLPVRYDTDPATTLTQVQSVR